VADRTGQRLGNYLLGRKLGAGGFAEVYLGEHLHLGTQAAIKVLNSKISDDEIARFRAEARTIARLKHPHIISVLDFGVDGGDPFLVMQYASGGTLRQHLPKGVQRSPASLLPSVRQIASALQYAHDARIVHRDIKPENMLLNERGDVLLSDFGIAVLTLSSRVQSAQDIAGTAAYMAPEQISAKPHLASDQYAFGIVLYEWLAGERPFEGTTVELFSKHVMTPPPPLSEKVPAISPAVEKVVLIALSKAPQDRFGSMQAFATAFEQACQEPARPLALSGGLPAATVTGQTPQPGDALPSQPTRISEPAPAETAVSATSTPSDGPATELTAAPREEEPRPDVTRRSVLAVAAGVGALAVVGGAAAWLGLVRKSATASPIARATATPTPYPTSTISLTPSATPLPPIKTIPTPLYTFRKHTRGLTILALAWSPQSAGQRVASGSFESLWVWDALTGAHASEFDTGWMTGVAWSPNGKYLAFNATSGGGYKLADATSGAIIASSTSINPSSLSWSPDGQRLAGGNAEPFVLVCDWHNGADSPARWLGHSGFVWNVA
jgi:serine/threonine protein kinase